MPLVAALKAQPRVRELLPEKLWRYLDEPLLASDWYPESDYWVLITALANSIDPRAVGGDVWRYFAKFRAQRDLAGLEGATTTQFTGSGSGVYRSFAAIDPSDPVRFFKRSTQLWSQYHDTGRLEVVGARPDSNAAVMRLLEFMIPIEGFVRLQGYYMEEYGRLVGVDVTAVVTRSTANNAPYCEWELQLPRTPTLEAYVMSLPQVL